MPNDFNAERLALSELDFHDTLDGGALMGALSASLSIRPCPTAGRRVSAHATDPDFEVFLQVGDREAFLCGLWEKVGKRGAYLSGAVGGLSLVGLQNRHFGQPRPDGSTAPAVELFGLPKRKGHAQLANARRRVVDPNPGPAWRGGARAGDARSEPRPVGASSTRTAPQFRPGGQGERPGYGGTQRRDLFETPKLGTGS